MHRLLRPSGTVFFTALALCIPERALAVDGVIEINQAKAIAGGLTTGDTAGFPVTVSAPGSYRLTSDLVVADAVSGISITSPDVTLDLNGFSVSSTAVTGTSAGIGAGTGSNVEVRNGTVRDFLGSGIIATGDTTHSVRIIDVRSINNGIHRLDIQSAGARIERCTATDNGSIGIRVADLGTLVLHSVAHSNTGVGLSIAVGSGYLGNVFNDNNGGNANAQVSAAGGNLGQNLCAAALCP